ncbi:bifunctional 2-polyprenyl-6-hydroxyphenol methylase/3-demethylubiquinol 3-O-methyltransferase UbiG [Paenibacillus xylanexedens]|uniref:class I SAM-dependent methyltransferase n=1 Tax=Paenibacillus xylanexedens TaxID=528191 RepID=UPI001C8D4824|nr:class I SAM-dependent methyltransferase [Paenibacillus xylanexedens]MBY0118886.1 methyltransferase domain-containing protein [Paenibacillus xylanexedens]
MKYDFELDLNSNNSLALIAKEIEAHTTVLEFGPATGRLTRYLKEKLHCDVYIVEIDQEAAIRALQYAKEGIVGDIENLDWLGEFSDIKFDYIIFADVLEHLYNPQRVLESAASLLKEDGSVCISIPNIAHNSVIIEMLQNKFEYRPIGILDDTHIRFFTYPTLINMIESSGYVTVKERAVIKKVGETEIANFFDGLPNSVSAYLKTRDFGDVYQYVLKIRKKNSLSEESVLRGIPSRSNYYFSQLYIDTGAGFNESQTIINNNKHSGQITFELDDFEKVSRLRFDPLNVCCSLKIESIDLTAKDGTTHKIESYETNAEYVQDSFCVFFNSDPQILMDLHGFVDLQKVVITLSILDHEFDKYKFIDVLVENIERTKKEQSELLEQFDKRTDIVHFSNEKLNNLKEILDNLLQEKESLKKENDEYKSNIYEVRSEKEELTVLVEKLTQELEVKVHEFTKSINERTHQLDERTKSFLVQEDKINEMNAIIENLEAKVSEQSDELNRIYASKRWKLISKFKKMGVD